MLDDVFVLFVAVVLSRRSREWW